MGLGVKRVLILICYVILAFIIVKASTLGWHPIAKTMKPSAKPEQLSKALEAHVYHLSEEIGDRSLFNYRALQDAEKYISAQFSSFGYAVEFQEYTISDKPTKNIIAIKEGLKNPQEIIVVGAHYDTCFNPGADDNASGVAALLELARLLRNEETSCSVKFIAFVNEEPPFFHTENMGSRVYVKAAKEREENIKGAIILEMIGYYSDKAQSQRYPPLFGFFYPSKGNFIGVVGNFSSQWLVKKVAAFFKAHSRFPVESVVAPSIVSGVDFSDNWSFWKAGYPAVMITDTAFYRYPHYHSESDTYEKLDYVSMQEVVKGLKGVLFELSNQD